MSSQSEYAGTAGSGNFVATGSNWTDPTNAEGAPSGSFATIASMLHGASSFSLDAYNFGFSVSGTINGLQGGVTSKMSIAGSLEFLQTYIELASTAGGFTANLLATTLMTTSAAAYSVGGATDAAGFTSQLTAANVNTNTENAGPTWGFTAKNTSASTSNGVSAEGMELTVYYTAGSVPGAPSFTIAPDATNPTTALDLTITAGTGSPTGYDIQEASTLGGTFSTIATNASSACTVSGLAPGTEYAFQVAGVNGSGVGSYCSPAATATEPAAPTGLSTTGTATTAVTLTFTAPSVGGTVSILDYAYRIESPVGAGNWSTPTVSGATVTGLTPGTQYGIEIAAVIDSSNGDWSGTIQGPWSSEITVTTLPGLPASGSFISDYQTGRPAGYRARRVEGVRFRNGFFRSITSFGRLFLLRNVA